MWFRSFYFRADKSRLLFGNKLRLTAGKASFDTRRVVGKFRQRTQDGKTFMQRNRNPIKNWVDDFETFAFISAQLCRRGMMKWAFCFQRNYLLLAANIFFEELNCLTHEEQYATLMLIIRVMFVHVLQS